MGKKKLERKIAELTRDNAAFRARESARMRSDHNAQQAKLRQAEREAKRKRIETISGGAIPFSYVQDATLEETRNRSEIRVTISGAHDEVLAIWKTLEARCRPTIVACGGYVPREAEHERASRVWLGVADALRRAGRI